MYLNQTLNLILVHQSQIDHLALFPFSSVFFESLSYHELAFQYNIVIVLVTHLRKEINVDHPFDAIYGSRGLTAGADSILVMYKRSHISYSRQLSIQGKDIPDDEITLVQNENCMLVVSEDEFDEQIDDTSLYSVS